MLTRTLLATLLLAAPAVAQTPPALTSNDPFPEPIPATEGVIRVNFVEFATIPDFNNAAPRVMHLVTEPGTRRMFAVNMQGPLYSISYDGRNVALYIDVNDPRWGVRDVQGLRAAAEAEGFTLAHVVAMPANNHSLVFVRGA